MKCTSYYRIIHLYSMIYVEMYVICFFELHVHEHFVFFFCCCSLCAQISGFSNRSVCVYLFVNICKRYRRRGRNGETAARLVEPEELQLGHAVHQVGVVVVAGQQRFQVIRRGRVAGQRRQLQAGVQQRQSRVHVDGILGDRTQSDQGTVVGQHRIAHVHVGTEQRVVHQPFGPETFRHE